MTTAQEDIYDVLGVGFGPANLAIATAFADHNVAAQKSAATADPAQVASGKKQLKVGFVESHPEFRWHPGMMIDGSRMQISFLKDLATIRDPTSPYTFLNYLASQNRLVTYINRSTFSPTRREYSDYMAWVATQVVDNAKASGDLMTGIVVHFGESVDHVEVVLDADAASDARLLRVCSKNVATGQRVTRLCRNLIVSPGGVPALPAQFRAGELKGHPGILHTSQYLDRIDDLLDDLFPTSPSTIQGAQSQSRSRSRARPHLRPTSTPPSLASPSPPEREGAAASSMERGPSAGSVVASLTSALHRQASLARGVRIAVVGGGQSSAETFLETRNRISALTAQRAGVDAPRPQIDLIIRRANLYPSDDSPFSNEVFDPTSTDYYYSLGSVTTPGQDGEGKGQAKSARQHVLGEAKSTNYAVVNPTTLDNVYEAMYEQRVEEDIARSAHPAVLSHDAQSVAHDPKLNIVRHSEISAVSLAASGPGFDVTLRHVLTGHKTAVRYDAIVLGTGYNRQSWRDMLFDCRTTTWSDDGRRMCDLFAGGAGMPSNQASQDAPVKTEERASNRCDGSCCVVSAGAAGEVSDGSSSHGTSDFTSEGTSTGTSTPESSLAGSTPAPTKKPQRAGLGTASDVAHGPAPIVPLFGVARNYRLNLPPTFKVAGTDRTAKFKPTIWLQGSNEATHGISDSLLSVLAVRSAEVLQGIEQEGWFGESA